VVGNIGVNYHPGAEGDRTYIAFWVWAQMLSLGIELGLAAYLLAGAPRLARWHLAKISQSDQEPPPAA
jgi:hypothetical protein